MKLKVRKKLPRASDSSTFYVLRPTSFFPYSTVSATTTPPLQIIRVLSFTTRLNLRLYLPNVLVYYPDFTPSTVPLATHRSTVGNVLVTCDTSVGIPNGKRHACIGRVGVYHTSNLFFPHNSSVISRVTNSRIDVKHQCI